MKKMKGILVPVLCSAATLILLRTLFLIGYVPSASMEPTLKQGSMIIGCRMLGELRTGDIIIFEHEGRLLVKRIAASPGETVEKNGAEITVPEHSYYMLGDNSANSYDSRYWSDPFVLYDDMLAKVIT